MEERVNRHLARVLAVQALYQYILLKTSTEEVKIYPWSIEEKIDEPTRRYASSLIEGTITHIDEIENIIKNKLQKTDLAQLHIMDKTILYLSVYSLLFLDDIPVKVIINEAIILAKEFGNYNSYKFINGILDAIRKDRKIKTV